MTYSALRGKCPNTELFLVHIFPHSDCIRRDTPYLSIFHSECGKIRTRKTSVFGHFSSSADFFLPSNAKISVTKAFLVVSLVFVTFRVYTSRQYGNTTFVCSSKLVHLGSKNLICFNL